MERYLTAEDVLATLQISRSKLYMEIRLGRFPQPVKIGSASRWPATEIEAHMAALAQARESV